MLDVLQEFEFAIGALAEDWGGEGLHDLLDRDGGAGQLVLCRTDGWETSWNEDLEGGKRGHRGMLTRQGRTRLWGKEMG